MKYYRQSTSLLVDNVKRIERALALLAIADEVDLYVPAITLSDRFLLNALTVGLHSAGFPPAVIYGEGDRWHLHVLSAPSRSPSIYGAHRKGRLVAGPSDGPDAA